MGVDIRWALWCRIKYLKERILNLKNEIEDLLCDDHLTDPLKLAINNSIATDRVELMLKLTKEMKACERKIQNMDRPQTGTITDEQIAQAKQYPIERLIEFDRSGNAPAWCHDDKKPSLHWHKKANRAHCFPCGKSFDSIAVLMERDGKTFGEAVKMLAERG